MTRDEAIAEAKRRNLEHFRSTGDLRAVWAELEVRPGVWNVAQYSQGPRPFWQRAVGFAWETVNVLNETPAHHRDPRPARVIRRRRIG